MFRRDFLSPEALQQWLKDWGNAARFYERQLWLIICFASGAGIYLSLDNEPKAVTYFLLWLSVPAAITIERTIPQEYRALAQYVKLMLFSLLLGFSYTGLRTHLLSHSVPQFTDGRYFLEGWVESVSGDQSRERFTMSLKAISGMEHHDMPDRVRLSQKQTRSVQPGRFVRCYAELKSPPQAVLQGDYDYSRDAFYQGIDAVGFVYGQCKPGILGTSENMWSRTHMGLNAFRHRLAAKIANKAGNSGGLAAALMTGDRSFLSEQHEADLRNSGLAHLLAISGLHMGLAGGAFYFLLFRILALIEPLAIRFPVQKLAATGALFTVTAYLVLSGASISAQRAYVMVAIAFLAVLFDRPVLSFQTLGLAMLVVLIIRPESVCSPGFRMSFAAAGALVRAFQPHGFLTMSHGLNRFGMIGRFIAPILITSVVAGLATTPFAIFHFGRVASFGLIANFCIMPIVTLICVPLAVLSAISLVIGMSTWPLYLFGKSLDFILTMAHFFAGDSGGASLFQTKPLSGFVLAALALAICYFVISGVRRIRTSAALFLMGGLIWFASPSPYLIYASSGDLFVRTKAGWVGGSIYKNGLAPLRFSEAKTPSCKEKCQIEAEDGRRIDMLPSGRIMISRNGVYQGELSILRDTKSFQLINSTGLKLQQIEDETCRPWRAEWPVCRNSDQ